MCMWGGGGCGGMGGGGVVRILQSLIGVIRSIYHIEQPNSPTPTPTPLPQVMNKDRPPFSYLFIYIFFILLFYLFIYSFFSYFFFFTKGVYQKELFYLTYLGSVLINLYLAFIWMRFGILLYREVRKKWFPSERRVSHM